MDIYEREARQIIYFMLFLELGDPLFWKFLLFSISYVIVWHDGFMIICGLLTKIGNPEVIISLICFWTRQFYLWK